MKIHWSIYGCLLIILFATGCTKDESSNASLNDYNYFPLEQGSWIVYDVDSIVHLEDDDNTNQTDTSLRFYRYQVKETMDSTFTDGEGDITFRIRREIRDTVSSDWSFMNVWTCKRIYNSAQRVEDNLRFVKLAFPVDDRRPWNGNAYNILPVEEYMYSDIHAPLSAGGFTFDSSVTVIQTEFISQINRIIKKEKYSMHIGMVMKQRDSLNVDGLIGQVLNGIEYRMTVNDYRR